MPSVSLRIEREIVVVRREPDFDRACDEALERVAATLDIDQYGHPADKRFSRAKCQVSLKFKTFEVAMGMTGRDVTYTFVATLAQD